MDDFQVHVRNFARLREALRRPRPAARAPQPSVAQDARSSAALVAACSLPMTRRSSSRWGSLFQR